MSSNRGDIERRVVRAAEAALAQRKFVTAIDVLVGIGWLEPRRVDEWRQGRVDYLERVTVANLGKISTAMRSFRRWAQARGLKPNETAYAARSRDRRPLRFSKSGDPGIERSYRTHWVSPELSKRKQARLAERQSRQPELVVSPTVAKRKRASWRAAPRRRGLGEQLEQSEAQRLADSDWIEWGGELIWVAGFTSGGAPYGLRVCDFDREDLEAMGLDVTALEKAGRLATPQPSIDESTDWLRDDDIPF